MRIRSIALLLGLGVTLGLALSARAQYDFAVLQPAGGLGPSEPFAINASGQSFGHSMTAPLHIDAALWPPSGTVLHDAGGSGSDTLAVNVERKGFEVSFAPGSRDAAGHFIGGTEIRALVAHAGKLFAGNGYWMDEPGPEGPQGAQILVLDRPGGRWRVDHAFDEQMPDGRSRYIAIGALGEVDFATDGNGKPLAKPASILLASTWDVADEDKVFARDDATGAWIGAALAYNDRNAGRRLSQVRSFAAHRDRVTGIDYAFAGQRPQGIFSGVYDPTAAGRIRWSQTPELAISALSIPEFRGMDGRLRVTSFAECNDRLYAAVGQQIYERIDGTAPHWRLTYTNPNPGYSQSGLRGLTAVASPSGHGQALIAGVEGTAPRIVRIDPNDGSETTELDLREFLTRGWGMGVRYAIAGYNDMTEVRDGRGEDVLLIGLEAVVNPGPQAAAGDGLFNIGRGRVVEGGAWYLIRHSNGSYDLRRIPPARPGQLMVATRSIVASPFPAERDAIYFGGFDASKTPVHDTAWIVRATLQAAIGGSH